MPLTALCNTANGWCGGPSCPRCRLVAAHGPKAAAVIDRQDGVKVSPADPRAGDWLDIPAPPPLDITPRSRYALVTVVVGPEAEACFAASGRHMRAFAAEHGYDFHVSRWPGAAAWPMSAKFGAARYLGHYDAILYADADVLFRPRCVDPLDHLPADGFGVVDELPFHRKQPQHKLEASYRRWLIAAGFPDAEPRHYFNAGVYVATRAARPLIDPPARLWVEAGGVNRHCAEQHLLNARIAAAGFHVTPLPRSCNWQSWTCTTCDGGFFKHAPADAVLHWSGAGAGRKARADLIREAATAAPWPPPPPFAPPAFLTPADPVAATDLRHVRWIRETLRTGRFRRALEVGCLHGYTSSAFLDAAAAGEVEAVHLCDPVVTPELTRTVAHYGVAAAIHRETSAALFARGVPYDLVFLDGDHTEPTVRAEAAALIAGGVRAVFAHDTSAREYPGCEGPQHLQALFVAAGYRVVEDHVARPGERTERGMLFAAKADADFAAGMAAYRLTCGPNP